MSSVDKVLRHFVLAERLVSRIGGKCPDSGVRIPEVNINCEYAGKHGTSYEDWHTGHRNAGLLEDELG